MRIKKGDNVEVVSGNDKGLKGTVHRAIPGKASRRRRAQKGTHSPKRDPNRDRLVVSGVNMVKKHQKPTGDVRTQVGIIEREASIHVSNLALVCPHCQQRTRVGFRVLESGVKIRFCKRCDQSIE
jgi:large subunit ribosomal protein L24